MNPKPAGTLEEGRLGQARESKPLLRLENTAESVSHHPALRSNAAPPAQLRNDQEEKPADNDEHAQDKGETCHELEARRDPDEQENHEGGLIVHHREGQDEAGVPSRIQATAWGHIQET